MKKKTKVTIIWVTLAVIVIFLSILYPFNTDIAVLFPKGLIGIKQRNLMVIATLLMFIVVIPVFLLTIYIVWKFRVGNQKSKYTPEWDNSVLLETIWWGIPCLIILVLSILTWKGTRELDPFKPIEHAAKPMTIQVVALQWKWLFIYPEQNIASINYLRFPENTPITFDITADAPMNAFWIPELGGMIFAMSGMKTKMNLIADHVGKFHGVSANLSGKGFAGMEFWAEATQPAEFEQWVESVRATGGALDLIEYNRLVKPSENNHVRGYVLADGTLYDQIVMKYMMPQMGK